MFMWMKIIFLIQFRTMEIAKNDNQMKIHIIWLIHETATHSKQPVIQPFFSSIFSADLVF